MNYFAPDKVYHKMQIIQILKSKLMLKFCKNGFSKLKVIYFYIDL